ncbi:MULTISPECIES: esterase/lipase family protein [Streptomyces]|uniref:esterase/lipase family protein n=1 Tax=Streptomyces TaxID=1883 RepID=UPI00345BEC91
MTPCRVTSRYRRVFLLFLIVSALLLPAPSAVATRHAHQAVTPLAGGVNDSSCRLSTAHPRPVVLVHGTFENAVDNWAVLGPYLAGRGYCVFSFDYGKRGVPLVYGLGPIEDSAGELATEVDTVLAATGASTVDIVGHSQGGMMPRYYMKFLGGSPKVNALVGLTPSNHGTTANGLSRLANTIGVTGAVADSAPAVSEQLVGSDFMRRLNAGGDTLPGVHYTVIATRYDEVVTPYQSQFLTGPDVRNILVQDLCTVDLSEHLALGTVDPIAFHEVVNALDPAHATRTNCLSALS